jgi:hypothetical protein
MTAFFPTDLNRPGARTETRPIAVGSDLAELGPINDV